MLAEKAFEPPSPFLSGQIPVFPFVLLVSETVACLLGLLRTPGQPLCASWSQQTHRKNKWQRNGRQLLLRTRSYAHLALFPQHILLPRPTDPAEAPFHPSALRKSHASQEGRRACSASAYHPPAAGRVRVEGISKPPEGRQNKSGFSPDTGSLRNKSSRTEMVGKVRVST